MIYRIKVWIPLAIITTTLSGLIYLTVQQNISLSANDPQIQIAEDTANMLLNGKKAEDVIPTNEVDLSKSLATFVILFNRDKQPTASSAVLKGKIPTLPKGVLEYADQHGGHRVTWQPEDGVRIAAVIVPFGGVNPGYVLVGRSLREIEKREEQLKFQVSAGWIIVLVATFIATAIFISKKK